MKKFIIKFLGLDKIQQELEYVKAHSHRLEQEIVNVDWTSEASNGIDYDTLAGYFDLDDIAGCFNVRELSKHLDMYELSEYVSADDIARELDISELAEHIDYSNLQEYLNDVIDIDTLAQTVSEKIADRDGMHQLISEEIENQGIGNGISQDAVESMIHTAIQQFADSLEVMVSAKLNINK